MNDPWTPEDGPVVAENGNGIDYENAKAIAVEKLNLPSLFLIISGAISLLVGLAGAAFKELALCYSHCAG